MIDSPVSPMVFRVSDDNDDDDYADDDDDIGSDWDVICLSNSG